MIFSWIWIFFFFCYFAILKEKSWVECNNSFQFSVILKWYSCENKCVSPEKCMISVEFAGEWIVCLWYYCLFCSVFFSCLFVMIQRRNSLVQVKYVCGHEMCIWYYLKIYSITKHFTKFVFFSMQIEIMLPDLLSMNWFYASDSIVCVCVSGYHDDALRVTLNFIREKLS